MTKQHFIALADTIKSHNKAYNNWNGTAVFNQNAINAIADFCAEQNPNFNRERWLGYIAGTCGKNGGRVSGDLVKVGGR